MPQDWFAQFETRPAAAPPASAAPSRLSGNEEKRFRSWYGGMAKRYDLNPDPDDPAQLYDYRGAFKANAKPGKDGHWPSQFKKPGHPNEVVGGFNTRTGERVPGTTRATESELVALGWEPDTAAQLVAKPEPKNGGDWFDQFTSRQPRKTARPEDFTERKPAATTPRPAAAPSDDEGGIGRMLADNAIGVAKGVGNTVIGLGEMVHRIPGVTRAVDALYGQPGISDAAFGEAREAVRPDNAAQTVGFAGEQIAEHFIPVGTAAKAAKVGQSALTTLAQSGDARAAGVSGALTAAVPSVVSAAGRASEFFRKGAIKDITRALAPTKEWAKSDAAKIAPGMLARGVRGSREAMLARAEAASDEVGAKLGDAYRVAAESGQTISGQVIRGELELAKDALTVTNSAGKPALVPGFEAAAKKLDQLNEFVANLGDDIPVDKAHAVKTAWDRLVSSAGLYGPKSMATATDNAEAWATREGASAIRRMLDDVPDVSALNKEYKFWISLRDVLKATELRTQGQSSGLFAAGGAGSAAVATAASGGGLTAAFMGGWAGKKLVEALQSPQFRSGVSAQTKDAIANALASRNTGAVIKALGRVTAAAPGAASSPAR